MKYSNTMIIAIANAVAVGGYVYLLGGGYRLTSMAAGAAGFGAAIGLMIAVWLERNGYTMDQL